MLHNIHIFTSTHKDMLFEKTSAGIDRVRGGNVSSRFGNIQWTKKWWFSKSFNLIFLVMFLHQKNRRNPQTFTSSVFFPLTVGLYHIISNPPEKPSKRCGSLGRHRCSIEKDFGRSCGRRSGIFGIFLYKMIDLPWEFSGSWKWLHFFLNWDFDMFET